jgi:hypothetical protein
VNKELNRNKGDFFVENRYQEGIITAIAFGGFFIIIGLLFVLTPNLWGNVTNFFDHMTNATYQFGSPGSTVALPAPAQPGAHQVLYTAFLQFCVALGILQLAILGLRIRARSRIGKVSETVGNAVFWLGAAFTVNTFLLIGTLEGWFQFWAALLVMVGVSFIARGLIYFVKKR